MARGSNSRDGRAARSELPSGVEATPDDISNLRNAQNAERVAQAYASNFEEESEYKSSGKVNFGDGQVGNGIIKDGKLFLREEDIDAIVKANFGGDNDIEEFILEGGGNRAFALFTGDNNKSETSDSATNKMYTIYNNEMGSPPIELPDADDYEVVDFEPGEDDEGPSYSSGGTPGYGASGSVGIGESYVEPTKLRIAYEKVTGLPMDRDSVKKLEIAIRNEADKSVRSAEETKSGQIDWDEYQRDRGYDDRGD